MPSPLQYGVRDLMFLTALAALLALIAIPLYQQVGFEAALLPTTAVVGAAIGWRKSGFVGAFAGSVLGVLAFYPLLLVLSIVRLLGELLIWLCWSMW